MVPVKSTGLNNSLALGRNGMLSIPEVIWQAYTSKNNYVLYPHGYKCHAVIHKVVNNISQHTIL